MKSCRAQLLIPLAAWLCAFIVPAPLQAGGHGNGHTNGVVCKVKVEGKGFIVISETQLRFFFDFKFRSETGAIRGRFSAFDEETGLCIVGVKAASLVASSNTAVIDVDVLVGKDQTTSIRIIAVDSGHSGECDSIQIITEAGTISGQVGRACQCDWGSIKVKVDCKEKCKGGAQCPGHPQCDEHPFCKGKICKGHPNCRVHDDDDDDDHGNTGDGDDDDGKDGDDDDDGTGRDDDDDGAVKCKGHPECKPKCKGKGFCKGHPQCTEHPFCEVPNCRGHKQCKDDKCQGHPECRKNFKHKKGCKAKNNPRQRCSCPGKKY